jgi:hypothetical protein
MDPVTISNLALIILKNSMAAIESGVKAGQIPVEVQERLQSKIAALRAGDFSGPEWQVDVPHSQ